MGGQVGARKAAGNYGLLWCAFGARTNFMACLVLSLSKGQTMALAQESLWAVVTLGAHCVFVLQFQGFSFWHRNKRTLILERGLV